MVKTYWLAVMFVAGIAVGVIFSRQHAGSVETPPVAAAPKVPAEARSADTVETPVAAARAQTSPRIVPERKAVPAGRAGSEASKDPAQPDSPAGYNGNSQPIDVGPVFREQFAAAESHGMKNDLLDFHQALEREVRNDAWAYSAESEIQNSLLAETSAGNFKVDHLECRATSCEVRLSARGKDQSEALSKWQQGMRSLEWGNQLQPRASSMIGRDEDADILVIFTQPEKKPQEKKAQEKNAPRKATTVS
jgi:hypothetical protein